MKSQLSWQGGMKFSATSDGISVDMDAKAPIGGSAGQTPKELVAAGLGGCTAMDVVALLKKHKQDLRTLSIDVDIETTKSGHPAVFTKALITFNAEGPIDPKVFLESVQLSQTKYCGVSAMFSKVIPIEYVVLLNGEQVGRGQANFTN